MVANAEYRASVCLQLLRRRFYEENNLQFYEGIVQEDNLFTFQSLLLAKRAGHLNKSLYRRRLRPASTMTKVPTFDNAYGYFVCYQEMCGFYQDKDFGTACNEAILQIIRRNLKNARRIYRDLPVEESQVVCALSPYEQMQFRLAVGEPAEEEKALKTEMYQRLQAQEQEIKHSITFRVGRKVLWLPNKIKMLLHKN